MVEVREITAATILTPQKIGSLAPYYDFSLNPYAGCAFSCSYCYVPKFPNARHEFTEWGGWVDVKVNAPQLIAREKMKVFRSRIFFSSATDPYQYLELKYRLSRRCLLELLKYQPAHITMHTRSHLILEDIELLKQFGDRLSVGVSFTTDDEAVRREFEPKAPSVERRVQLLKTLHENGVDAYVSMSPLLPCNPERLVALIAPYAKKCWIDMMRWTEINTKPELLEKYKAHFDVDDYSALVKHVKQLFTAARLDLAQRDSITEEPHARKSDLVRTKSMRRRKSVNSTSYGEDGAKIVAPHMVPNRNLQVGTVTQLLLPISNGEK